MAKKYWLIIAAALSIAVFLQCSKSSSPSGPPSGSDPTFAGDIQPVFTGSCATSSACHAAPGQEGLVLSPGQAYSHLVNVSSTEVPALWRVRPAKTDSSYVVNKIEGTQAVGVRMPPSGSALSAATIQKIKTWITKDAKNN